MKLSDKGPAYRIETDRLEIRCWRKEDAEDLRSLIDDSDDHLRPYIPFMKNEPRSLEQTRDSLSKMVEDFHDHIHYRYGVFFKDHQTLIGEVMLLDRENKGDRELGYWLGRDFCGQGYMLEASAVLTRIAMEIDGAKWVEAQCDSENVSSTALLKKLGFKRIKVLEGEADRTDGSFGDLEVWRFSDSSETFLQRFQYQAWNDQEALIRDQRTSVV